MSIHLVNNKPMVIVCYTIYYIIVVLKQYARNEISTRMLFIIVFGEYHFKGGVVFESEI